MSLMGKESGLELLPGKIFSKRDGGEEQIALEEGP